MTPVHLDLTAYQSMELLQAIAAEVSSPERVQTRTISRNRG